jgi:integrase
MDPSLLNRMKLWASGQGYPTSGWVFPAQRGDNPINMTALSARVIKTTLKKLGLEFSFYGLRRGFGTALVLAGATLTVTADALGNSEEIVERHYFIDKENVPAAKGMQKLNAARAAKQQGPSESEFPEPLTLTAEGAGNE